MDMSLSKLSEIVKNRESWCAAVHEVTRIRHNLVTEQQQESDSLGLPFPSPRDLLDPGIELRSPALQADALPAEPPGKPIINNAPLHLFPHLGL